MRASRMITVLLAALALSAAAASAARAPSTAGAHSKAKAKRVSVADFYFGPEKLTIKKGQAVRWVWAATNAYPHDVHLKRGPRGLKKKGSYSTRTTAVTDAEFRKAFTRPGTYHFICTIHPTQMRMTIVVKK